MALTTKRKLSRFGLVLVTTCCSLLIAACAVPERAPAQAKLDAPARALTVHTGRCTAATATCSVDVNVNNCVLSVYPPTIVVPANHNHIKWTIQTADKPGYHFEEDGITYPIGSGITSKPGVIGGGNGFMVTNDHSVKGFIEFTVTVVKDSDKSACPPLDPYIFNQ